MTIVKVNIETVAGVKVTFTQPAEYWSGLNQYEQDDIISCWVNENDDAQTAISKSSGYILKWEHS